MHQRQMKTVTPLRDSVNLTVGVTYEAYDSKKDKQVVMVKVGGRFQPLMKTYFV